MAYAMGYSLTPLPRLKQNPNIYGVAILRRSC